MQLLSTEDVQKWFAASPCRGTEYVSCDSRGLFFTDPEASCIDLEYPKLEKLPFFSRLLTTVGYESRDFEGALVWFTTWGVWNLPEEGVGYHIVEAMHRAAGEPKSFEVAPGHLFRADELDAAIGILMQPMIFGWDALYRPHWSYGTDEFFLHVSHDAFVTVATRTREFYDKVFGLLQEVDLQPKPGHDLQLRRFCRAG